MLRVRGIGSGSLFISVFVLFRSKGRLPPRSEYSVSPLVFFLLGLLQPFHCYQSNDWPQASIHFNINKPFYHHLSSIHQPIATILLYCSCSAELTSAEAPASTPARIIDTEISKYGPAKRGISILELYHTTLTRPENDSWLRK